MSYRLVSFIWFVCHKDICVLSLRSSNHLYLIIMQHGNVSLFFHLYFYLIVFSLAVSCLFIIRNIIIRGWYKYYCIIIIISDSVSDCGYFTAVATYIQSSGHTHSQQMILWFLSLLLMIYHAVFSWCIWEKNNYSLEY